MKKILKSLMLVAYQPMTLAQNTVSTESDLKIIGVKMYADWCGKCKAMDPKLSEVRPRFEGQPVLFTRFDMTNDFTIGQSRKLASLLGLSELFEQHKGRTGYMVLVNAQTSEVIKTLKHNQSEEELEQEIAAVL